MADSVTTATTATASKAVVKTSPTGVLRRIFELMMMLVSAILVLFAWDTAQKAQEESRELREELK